MARSTREGGTPEGLTRRAPSAVLVVLTLVTALIVLGGMYLSLPTGMYAFGNGVKRVRLTNDDYERLPLIVLRETLSLCRDHATAYCRPFAIDMAKWLPDDRIVMGSRRDQLRIYDRKGEFVRYIGSRGRLFNEYKVTGALEVLPDGHIRLFDEEDHNLRLFDSTGYEPGGSGVRWGPELRTLALSEGRVIGLNVPEGKSYNELVIASFDVIWPDSTKRSTGVTVNTRADRVADERSPALPPYIRAVPVWALAPEKRLIVGNGSAFHVESFKDDAMEWVLDVERPAVPVPPEALLSYLKPNRNKGSYSPEFLQAMASNGMKRRMASDKVYPRITSLVAMRDGSSWIRENAYEDETVVPWVVVGRDGVPRGKVLLPPTARPLDGDGSRVLVRMPGAGDFPHLVEYAIYGTMGVQIASAR